MVLWRVIHNCIAHPLLALADGLSTLADFVHGRTAAKAYPRSACVVIADGERVLAVARRGTASLWGLPGGKADGHESLEECAVREVLEETRVRVGGLREVYRAMVGDTEVTTFFAQRWSGAPANGDAGPVSWVTWDELLTGAFRDYNSVVMRELRVAR